MLRAQAGETTKTRTLSPHRCPQAEERDDDHAPGRPDRELGLALFSAIRRQPRRKRNKRKGR